MRVLVCPDKFAGTLTATQAALAVTEGWTSVDPGATIERVPLSDGGPGFLDCVRAAWPTVEITVGASGPLGQAVEVPVLVVDDATERRAFVESASVVGLMVPGERDPWRATTAGLAEPLRAAVDAGATQVVVGVGGTATTDGGRGLVEALGRWSSGVELVGAVDVRAPLLGARGAAQAFAPQKGAGPELVARLETRLAAWAREWPREALTPGAGAGGGLGFGLLRLGGRLVPGAGWVADVVHLQEAIARADVVVTGEGRFDATSLDGKVVGHVVEVARSQARPCLVIVGQSALDLATAAEPGVDAVWSLAEVSGSAASALAAPAPALRAAAAEAARVWSRP